MSSLDSSDLECPHCGTTFYDELTRCPTCGRNLYPDEDESETSADIWGVAPESLKTTTSQNTSPHPLTGILVGSFLSTVIGLILFFVLNKLFPTTEVVTRYISLTSIPLSAFTGGYIASALNLERPFFSGFTVGLLSLALALLLTAYQSDLAAEPLLRPETISWWAVILLAAIVGSFLRYRTTQKTTLQHLFSPRTETQLYTELLSKVQFDRATAESLIAYEQKRAPTGTRFVWIQNAIDRWERDNRTNKYRGKQVNR